MKHFVFGFTLISLTAPSIAQEHRQHDAHEHGAATMNLAIEGNDLYIELESPAVNLVGFEHAPRTDEERAQITQTVSALRNGAMLFKLNTEAKCALQDVMIEGEQLSDKHSHEHESSHAEFSAGYQFSCQHVQQLEYLDVRLFEHFPATERLQVQMITPDYQGMVEVDKHDYRIALQ